jgi:uncharacterized repeat protein (TIGR02543 family)
MRKRFSRTSIATFLALIVLLMTTFAIPCAPAQGVTLDGSECWGVFIGISDLQNYPWAWTNADDDAVDFSQALSPTWGTDHVRVLTNSQATKAAILSAINWLATNADSNDTVVFFVSEKTYLNEIYCYDYVAWGDEITGAQLNSAFSSVQASKKIFIFTFWEEPDLRSALSGSGRIVIFASHDNETIWWQDSHNIFVSYLVEAFDDFGGNDANSNYELSMEEVFAYASSLTTSDHSGQHPAMYDQITGETPLIAKFVFDNNVSLPVGATVVTIDGTDYMSAPRTKYWMPGGSHTITVPELVSEGTDTRYVFTGWESGGTDSTIYVSKGAYTAEYNTEYLLTITSPYDTPTGEGWYVDGATASFSITAYLETSDTKRYFTGWSGDFTGTDESGSIVMDAPKSLVAGWRTEFLLTINSEYGAPTGAGWYDEGESAAIYVESVQGFLIRQIFDGWTGDVTSTDPNATVTMNEPKVVTATWHSDYLQLYIGIVIVVVVIAGIVITIVLVRRKGGTPRGPAAAPPAYTPPSPGAGAPPPPPPPPTS